MIIKEAVLRTLNSSIDGKPPETGGILGSKDGIVITEVVIDKTYNNIGHFCAYIPNIEFLNSCIDEWMLADIGFMGMFHTHFGGSKKLSCGDQKYIFDIMNAMPQEINMLYFPIFVLPKRELVSYKAFRINGSIEIKKDDIKII